MWRFYRDSIIVHFVGKILNILSVKKLFPEWGITILSPTDPADVIIILNIVHTKDDSKADIRCPLQCLLMKRVAARALRSGRKQWRRYGCKITKRTLEIVMGREGTAGDGRRNSGVSVFHPDGSETFGGSLLQGGGAWGAGAHGEGLYFYKAVRCAGKSCRLPAPGSSV